MNSTSAQMRQPTFYIPHGGGPCLFMEWSPPETWEPLRAWLAGLIGALPEEPAALLVATAHWEADPVRITASAAPGLVYDYSGFPPETYELTWPAPGSPELAARIRDLLQGAGIGAELESERGFDHGVFVPLKVMRPQADIPTVAISLHPGLDPDLHHRMGVALAALRDEGVLIVGSGNSYHNMQGFAAGDGAGPSSAFDAWLADAAAKTGDARATALSSWPSAPAAAPARRTPDPAYDRRRRRHR